MAGDISPAEARKKIEHWFSDVERGATDAPMLAPPAARLDGVIRETLTDQVQLPRLYLTWHTPALYAPGDAELDVAASVLTGGKNSRLYKRLVYDMQVAQSVNVFQSSNMLSSLFYVVITARPSNDPPAQDVAAAARAVFVRPTTASAPANGMTRFRSSARSFGFPASPVSP